MPQGPYAQKLLYGFGKPKQTIVCCWIFKQGGKCKNAST